MILLSFLSAKQQQYATYPYRMGNMPARSNESRLYHVWGATFIFVIMCSFAWMFSTSIIAAGVLLLLNMLIYWMLFDPLYSIFIGQQWYYLGNEAAMDRLLKKLFGINAGKRKAIGCIIIITIINIIHLLN